MFGTAQVAGDPEKAGENVFLGDGGWGYARELGRKFREAVAAEVG